MKIFRQIIIFLFCINTYSFATFLNTDFRLDIFQSDDSSEIIKDGFLAGTKIATLNGLIPIENLNSGDFLAEINEIPNQITNISLALIPEYIKITILNEIIKAVPDQQFYMAEEDKWIVAKNLQAGHLFNSECNIISVEKIEEYKTAYKLTTSSHTFNIFDNIHVHNADPITGTLSIGYVIFVNPVLATIGATIALTAFSKFLYEKLNNEEATEVVVNPTNKIESIKALHLFDLMESEYYLGRKKNLLELKEKFIAIKEGIENSGKSFNKGNYKTTFNINTFSNLPFLKKTYIDIHLSEKKELTDQERTDIRKKREIELLTLETKIIELQTVIIFHFNELIESMERIYQLCEQHDGRQLQIVRQNYEHSIFSDRGIQAPIERRNAERNELFEPISLKNYEKIIFALTLFDKAEMNLHELKMTINYYNSKDLESIINATTNIPAIIKILEKEIPKKEGFLKKTKADFLKNKKIDENFLSWRGYNINNLYTNFLNKSKQAIENYESLSLLSIKEKYKKVVTHKATLCNTINDSKRKKNDPCKCGKCKSTDKTECKLCSCGCSLCGCDCKDHGKKMEPMTKPEFLKKERIKNNYEHYNNHMYKLKHRKDEIVKNSYYLDWDFTHSDLEVWSKGKMHQGCLCPHSLEMCPRKPGIPSRIFSSR